MARGTQTQDLRTRMFKNQGPKWFISYTLLGARICQLCRKTQCRRKLVCSQFSWNQGLVPKRQESRLSGRRQKHGIGLTNFFWSLAKNQKKGTLSHVQVELSLWNLPPRQPSNPSRQLAGLPFSSYGLPKAMLGTFWTALKRFSAAGRPASSLLLGIRKRR